MLKAGRALEREARIDAPVFLRMIKTARGSTTSVKATTANRTANTFLTFAPRAVIEMIIFTEYRSEVRYPPRSPS
jgi:hypothetical protein